MKSYCHIYGQFGQTGDRLPEESGHLLDLGLACDTDVQLAQAARHRDLLRELQRRGGLVAPNIYWVAEKGAPGLISHLWLTAPRSGSGGGGCRS